MRLRFCTAGFPRPRSFYHAELNSHRRWWGLVSAALMLVIVGVVYGLSRRRRKVANVVQFLEPKRKGDLLDWLR